MARPSSRVSAPPGGSGSDIFGTSASYVPPQPVTISAQRAAQNMSSSVFAGPGASQPAQQQRQQPQQQQQQAAGGSASQSNMGGYGSYDITGKPTSRVLAPPGGGSSISFGAPQPQVAQQQPSGVAAQRAAANSQSSVFAQPQQIQQVQQQQVQPQQQPQMQQVQQQQYQPQAAGGTGSQQNMGGYGTYDITGKPSSRVLAPPGGASSNIFGGSAQPQQQQQPQGIASQRAAQGMQSSVFSGPAVSQPQQVSPQAQAHLGVSGPELPRSSTRVHAPPGGGSQITFG